MAEATKTAAPARTRRTPAKTAATKPAAKTAPVAEPTAETTEPKTDRFVVELDFVGNTASYARFNVPTSLKGTMVGSIYAPHGTDKVKVAIMGVDGVDSEE